MSFLEIAGLSKRFGEVVALDGIDLDVEEGTSVAIVGPSGSGKTTLLRLVAGFDVPDRGRIVMGVQTLTDGARAVPAHERGIGVVAQDGALFPHLSVRENIGFGLSRRDPNRGNRIAEMLAMVELDGSMLERRPDQLSGGQQQRVALARAMATRPRLMLLDEPFSALDTGLRATLRDAVSKLLQAAGITTILITHDQAEALSFADKVGVLRDGRFQQVGTPTEIYFQPRDRMVAEFMGDCLILPAIAAGGHAACALGEFVLVDGAHRGTCNIMLRPEQILLRRESDGPLRDGEKPARLLDIDFAGRTSTATVSVVGDAVGVNDSVLALPGIGSRGLSKGESVIVSIVGPAHLLPLGRATGAIQSRK